MREQHQDESRGCRRDRCVFGGEQAGGSERDGQRVRLHHQPVELRLRPGDRQQQRVGDAFPPATSRIPGRPSQRAIRYGARSVAASISQLWTSMFASGFRNGIAIERHEHAEAVLSPEKGRPALQAHENGDERVGALEGVQAAEVDPCRDQGDEQQRPGPGVAAGEGA